ncbi:MAG TPA: FAD-dependent oxidoreductase, partial [Allosphingosinicella sp.]|nr:FAD-dependent oxidoreductase [Allosphingosinicella sp.]
MNAPATLNSTDPVVIVGGGFTGLSAAYELAKAGKKVVVLEKEPVVGGLASGFMVGEFTLEKFYHHWFTNDVHVMDLIE